MRPPAHHLVFALLALSSGCSLLIDPPRYQECEAPDPSQCERVLNTTIESNQDEPNAAAGADGFLVVFEDESLAAPDRFEKAIRARVLNSCGEPVGGDFLINDVVTGAQESARTTAGTQGTYLVVWSDDSGAPPDPDLTVRARALRSDGSFASSELVVPTSTNGPQSRPSVAGGPDGGFLVVWSDGERQIRGRSFDAIGSPRGPDFAISTDRTGSDAPVIAFAGTDRFLVVWQARDVDVDIFARFVGVAGESIGPELKLNSSINADQTTPAVALGDGVMMAAWTDLGPVAQGRPIAISGRLIGPDGPKGDDFLIADSVQGQQVDAAIGGAPGDSFMVAWAEEQLTDVADVRSRAFSFAGAPLMGAERLNSIIAGDQDDPTVATGSRGTLIAWGDQSGVEPDALFDSVRFRFFARGASDCVP